MADFVRVASVDEVPPGEMKIVEVDGEDVVLANVDGQIYAIGGTCTHRGGPLGEGVLEGDVVECPFHAGQFNVRTGEVVGPPPSEPVKTYAVRVDGGDIKVAAG
ncbi:MAG: non-heme iron oxygenase ferredoxin subunit [Chloroflexi bacterium]|nr:non-heme iron oxygenase ferredoxin subunit [Chloroflexota bacterium]